MKTLLDLIKQSVMTDSNVSMMRLGSYIVAFALLALYAVQVIASVVSNILAGRPIGVLDIPAVMASLIGGLWLAKGVQSFSKSEGA